MAILTFGVLVYDRRERISWNIFGSPITFSFDTLTYESFPLFVRVSPLEELLFRIKFGLYYAPSFLYIGPFLLCSSFFFEPFPPSNSSTIFQLIRSISLIGIDLSLFAYFYRWFKFYGELLLSTVSSLAQGTTVFCSP